MLPDPGESFEREYGCHDGEWRGWLPAAVHGHALTETGPHGASVAIGSGMLELDWQVLPPRVIALLKLPRLSVRFRFSGVAPPERLQFLRRFDMRMQRGGG